MSTENVLTRRELYDLVWAKPTSKVASEFGISDRGLAKLCARHKVPVPPRGYWARLAAGKGVLQFKLQDIDEPDLDRVEISGALTALPTETRRAIAEAKAERKAE